MSDSFTTKRHSGTGKIVAAAALGAVCGLVATAVALRSVEFGIFGAVGGALAAMIATLSQLEPAEA